MFFPSQFEIISSRKQYNRRAEEIKAFPIEKNLKGITCEQIFPIEKYMDAFGFDDAIFPIEKRNDNA
jgi:hypothetical protein